MTKDEAEKMATAKRRAEQRRQEQKSKGKQRAVADQKPEEEAVETMVDVLPRPAIVVERGDWGLISDETDRPAGSSASSIESSKNGRPSSLVRGPASTRSLPSISAPKLPRSASADNCAIGSSRSQFLSPLSATHTHNDLRSVHSIEEEGSDAEDEEPIPARARHRRTISESSFLSSL